ncbi:tetratricopeptide repeat protein [Larsenimonas salina]|uniref:tetratricopeptide repeat protein n=1 Tax=Larsenimonas salina TaxID=1295565 RepID=UPI0020731840|nr:hypothetical protein [Larsenimonas salina]MCM5703247.1 hypothetical protein [Larsenimonas salina]
MNQRRSFHIALAALGLSLSMAVQAAGPALSQSTVDRIDALSSTLSSNPAAVVQKAGASIEALGKGRSQSDRWARALYEHLMARAYAHQGQPGEAARYFARAHSDDVVPLSLRREWLREEARYRLEAGQTRRGRALFERWAAQARPDANDYWTLTELAAEARDWPGAARYLKRARRAGIDLTPQRQSLADAIHQHSGDYASLLSPLLKRLDAHPGDRALRLRAVALYQRLGEAGKAAAIWEAGWQRGVLSGAKSLDRLVALHLAAGTPARAAEWLEKGLSSGTLEETTARRRTLAEAWTAARARDKALASWTALAERTGAPEDWRDLGELAYSWGDWSQVITAMTNARKAGLEDTGRSWLLQGVAAFSLEKDAEATQALEQAIATAQGQTRTQAQAWYKALTAS